MTALNLGDATRVLTPPSAAFADVAFGDVDFVPASSPHPVVSTPSGYAIPRATEAGGTILTSSDAITPTGDWALFIAFSNASALSIFPAVATGGTQCQLVLNPAEILGATFAGVNVGGSLAVTAFGNGVTVIGLSASTVETLVATNADGVVATGDPAETPSAETWFLPDDGGGADLLGMWMFEDTTVDATTLTDTIAAIVAALDVPPIPAHATGEWAIEAPTATVTVGGEEPFVDIDDLPEPGGDETIPADPEPDPGMLATYLVRPLRHVWERMPAPTIASGRPVGWKATASGNAPYGFRQIIVNGIDATVVDGVPTPIPSTSDVEPFGFAAAHIDLPSVGIGRATPSWAVAGANVHIRIALCDENMELTGQYVTEYRGIVIEPSTDESGGAFGLDCIGLLFQADLQTRPLVAFPQSLDIGSVIADALNGVVGRRYNKMSKVVTGIRTATSGGGEALLAGYVQKLLATAYKGGKQWTVAVDDKTPVLRQKNRTTIHASVRDGQRGVSINLSADASQSPNVIYCEGVNSVGGRWANWKYPNWKPDDTPPYPLAPSKLFYVGLKDSQTTSGRGVSDAQAKLGRPVTGTWNRGDVTALSHMQERAGITVDGKLGPQSWAAMFDTGANTGSLDGAQQFPLAIAKEVQPFLYGPDGDKLGPNPAYNPAILRVEARYNLGQGVSKTQGRNWAREVLKRDSGIGWAGTITFHNGFSPEERHASTLRAGMNIKVYGHRGEDRVLHIAAVDRYDGEVRLTVDTRARDYPTLEAILERDRNAVDPAKAAVQRILKGNVSIDRPEFDAESPAGRMPRHAVNGGYWDVRRIPLGAFGTVALTEFHVDNPTKFCIAVFGKKVTANQLLSWVGNPLTATENPWDDDELDKRGLIISWGWKKQPLGYGRATFSNPDGETGKTLTGRFVDDGSWEFASASSPWVWVAMMTAADCIAWGRFYGRAGD